MLLPALLPSADGCSSLLGTCVLQVERLQRKFATIHSTLAQQQNNKPGPDTPRMSSLAHLHTENSSKVGLDEEGFYKLWPANKADHLCLKGN